MEVTIDVRGLEEAYKITDPVNVYNILMKWYQSSTVYIKDELKSRTPQSGKGKVRVRFDAYRPPRWARVRVYTPLAHIWEGGTGRQGAAGFNHNTSFFPNVDQGQWSIARTMGLPKAEAFLVARSIARRGGNPPKPFIYATYLATKNYVENLMDRVIKDVLGT